MKTVTGALRIFKEIIIGNIKKKQCSVNLSLKLFVVLETIVFS